MLDVQTMFTIALLVAPLPAVYTVVKVVGSFKPEDSVFGWRHLDSLAVKISGAVVTYLVAALATIATFAPYLIDLELKNFRVEWKAEIQFTTNMSQQPERFSGTLTTIDRPGHSVKINGELRQVDGLSADQLAWKASGIVTNDFLYIPIRSQTLKRDIAALGDWDPSSGEAELDLFFWDQSDVENDDLERISGILSLKREYPWVQILVMASIPLGLLIVINFIAPILSGSSAFSGRIPGVIGTFETKFGAGTTAYLLIFLVCYIAFMGGLPRTQTKAKDESYQVLERYMGEWYFRLAHSDGSGVMTAANMNVSAPNLRSIRVTGRLSTLYYLPTDRFNCYAGIGNDLSIYDGVDPSKIELRWSSELAALVEGELLVFYNFDASEDYNPGLLRMRIGDHETGGDQTYRWTFYDRIDPKAKDDRIDRGVVDAFRPSSVTNSVEQNCFDMISAAKFE